MDYWTKIYASAFVAAATVLLPQMATAQSTGLGNIVEETFDMATARPQFVSRVINPDGSIVGALVLDQTVDAKNLTVDAGKMAVNTLDINASTGGLFIVDQDVDIGTGTVADSTVSVNSLSVSNSTVGALTVDQRFDAGRMTIIDGGQLSVNQTRVR